MIPLTLSRYIVMRFALSVGMVAFAFSFVALCIDFLEINRRYAANEHVSLSTLASMSLWRVPFFAMKTLPFAILLGGLLSFFFLNRHGELIVARACGMSAFQFLIPIVGVSFLFGMVVSTVVNPFVAASFQIAEEIKNRDIRGQKSAISLSRVGLWLTDNKNSSQTTIIHIRHINSPQEELQGITFFFFDDEQKFIKRMDATRAFIHNSYWQLHDVHIIIDENVPPQHMADYRYETDINFNLLQDNFLPPESVSFWDFPEFIDIMEKTGFSSVEHRLHYYHLWMLPFSIAVAALLGLSFTFHAVRHRATRRIAYGFAAGFLLFQLAALLDNFALSGRLPLALAVMITPLVGMATSLLMLLHEENA